MPHPCTAGRRHEVAQLVEGRACHDGLARRRRETAGAERFEVAAHEAVELVGVPEVLTDRLAALEGDELEKRRAARG